MKVTPLFDKLSAAKLTALGFLLFILGGTAVLMLPLCASSDNITFVEALFTATSAVCVTGLAVLDTGKDFSLLGQGAILVLIQLGGLGIMVLSSGFVLLLGGRLGLRQKSVLTATVPGLQFSGTGNVLKGILFFTFGIEALGAILLFFCWLPDMPWNRAAGYAIFHSISAFCNAGFSPMSNSLTDYATHPGVNVVLSLLIIIGGVGFLFCDELRQAKKARRRPALSAVLAIRVTVALVILGTVLFYIFERTNPHTIGNMSGSGQFWASLFQSVTSRTAGFNSVDIGSCRTETLQMIMSLMIVGGSPGSTAGGLKTTTLALLLVAVYSNLRGRSQVTVLERAIPTQRVTQALATVVIMLSACWFGAIVLSTLEPSSFDQNLFESVSALSTTGLSTGITADLSVSAKLLICLYMFIGRVGPLTLAVFLVTPTEDKLISYVKEDITLG